MNIEKVIAAQEQTTALPAGVAAGRARVLSIQVLRGVAACFVVLYHTDIILGRRSYGTNAHFEGFAQWGWLGVNLFFVISGFTIFLAHHRDVGMPSRIGRYAWRRFARIYPIYWLLLLVFLLATQLKVDYRALDIRPGNLLTAFTLLPFVQDPELPLKVAWTLLFEVMFYALFAITMLHRGLARLLWPCWTIAIIATSLIGGRYALDPLNIYNIYFVLGGIAWWLMPRMDRRWVLPLFVLLLLTAIPPALVASPLSNIDRDNIALALLAPPVALLLLLCIALEKSGTRIFEARPLLLIGDASYSIYLVHSAFLSLAGAAQSRALVFIPGVVYFCLAGVGAVVAGIAIHLWVERPLLAMLRDVRPGKRAKAATSDVQRAHDEAPAAPRNMVREGRRDD